MAAGPEPLLASPRDPGFKPLPMREIVALWQRRPTYGINGEGAVRAGPWTDERAVKSMGKGTVAIASDHAGYELKSALKGELERMQVEVLDLGANGPASVDYPDFGYAMAHALREQRADRGVLVCGSGIGISIAANRFAEVRAALVHDSFGAQLAREHNDANVICFGGRMIGEDVARECLRVFMRTAFQGGRHARRIEKLNNPK